ncbi:MAG: GAF domain-containing protein [Verrucomicrobiota bacterium]
MSTETTELATEAVSPTDTFIRVTEIWILDDDRSNLVLSSGAYGELDIFHELSSKTSFGFGEGLPGLAWKNASPVILNEFEGSVFKRTKEAHAAGLTSAIAFPIFSGEFLQAVVVFLCGNSAAQSGAIEVWADNGMDEMELDQGYYGDLRKFETLSRSLQFHRGRGLPGIAYETGLPLIMSDFASDQTSFLRAKYAGEVGIQVGIAIPFYNHLELSSVVTLLSSGSTPIARRFEIWLPSEDHSELEFHSGVENGEDVTSPAGALSSLPRGDKTLGSAWLQGIPLVTTGEPADGYDFLLALPIIDKGSLNSVVACYN